MEVAGPFALIVLIRQKAGLEEQVFYSAEKISVEVGDVVEKMCHHVPEGFMRHHIFLAAILAILPLYDGTTIKAVPFFSLWNMRHVKILLKNKYKKYIKAFFFVTKH